MINYIFVLILCITFDSCSFVLAVRNKSKIIKFLCSFLLLACVFRYISLFVFCLSKTGASLYDIRYLVMLSAPALTIVPFLILFTVNKEKISRTLLAAVFALLCVYSYIIVKAPNGITISNDIYAITMADMWKYIIAVIQSIFMIISIVTAVKLAYRKNTVKIIFINIFYALSCIFSLIENFLRLYGFIILPSPVISELLFLIYIFICLYFYIDN